MKGRDVALFVSIQGVLLGAAFVLSSGETNFDARNSQNQNPVQVESWIDHETPVHAVAQPMSMPESSGFEPVGRVDSVPVALERAHQQRSWVF